MSGDATGDNRGRVTAMMSVRLLAGAIGVVIALVGVRDLLDRGWSGLEPVLVWLVVGNVLHDGVLVPIVLVLGVVLARVAPEWVRGPVVGGFVVLGALTLVAVPVLGNSGGEASNPSLMPRNYWLGWSVIAVLAIVLVALRCLQNKRRTRRSSITSGSRTVGHVDPGSEGSTTP